MTTLPPYCDSGRGVLTNGQARAPSLAIAVSFLINKLYKMLAIFY